MLARGFMDSFDGAGGGVVLARGFMDSFVPSYSSRYCKVRGKSTSIKS